MKTTPSNGSQQYYQPIEHMYYNESTLMMMIDEFQAFGYTMAPLVCERIVCLEVGTPLTDKKRMSKKSKGYSVISKNECCGYGSFDYSRVQQLRSVKRRRKRLLPFPNNA